MEKNINYVQNLFVLKKNFKTHFLFRFGKLEIFLNKRSVHSVINFVKNWDLNLGFFINAKILLSFEFLNKSRLKNLFLFFIKNKKIWNEILRMINSRVIDFSPKIFLFENGFYYFNLLSVLLFDIYFSELDIYVLNLSYKFNCRRSSKLGFKNQSRSWNKNAKYIDDVSPLKFSERTINSAVFLKRKNRSALIFKFFEKKINYVRYMNFFLLGLSGSKVFVLKIKRKLVSFVIGNLHFDLTYCNIFSIFESQNFFLGHQIRCAFLFLK